MAITPPQPLPTAYTTSSLVASARSAGVRYPDLAPFASVPVTITNTGAVKSDFVVLGFLRGTFGPAPQPRKSLVAFARVHDVLPNGGRANATLEISLGSIARAAENGDLVLFPGTYRVELDLDGSVGWNFTISGEQVTLDSYPAR